VLFPQIEEHLLLSVVKCSQEILLEKTSDWMLVIEDTYSSNTKNCQPATTTHSFSEAAGETQTRILRLRLLWSVRPLPTVKPFTVPILDPLRTEET
jgi:hypothetical protein